MLIPQLRAIASRSINHNAKRQVNRFYSIARFIIIALLSFALTIIWMPTARGQISLFSVPQDNNSEQAIWDINSPKPCGNLVCSTVYLDGWALFTLAAKPTADKDSTLTIDERAKNVQNILQQIVEQKTNSQAPGLTELSLTFDEQRQQIVLNQTEIVPSEIDTSTLKVEVGIENNQTVIFLPAQPGLQQQTILTVNEYDAQHNGKPIDDLAQQWRDKIRKALSQAIAERQWQTENPLAKPAIIAAIAAFVILVLLAISWVRKRLRKFDEKLRHQLKELQQSLAVNPEEVTSDSEQDSGVAEDNQSKKLVFDRLATTINDETTLANGKAKTHSRATRSKRTTANPSGVFAVAQHLVSTRLQSLLQNLPRVSLQQHSILKQEQNLIQLLLRLFFLVQFVILLLGAGAIAAVYPDTRIFFMILFTQAFGIPLLWMAISLADKISDILIDRYLHRWAEDAQITAPNSQRYALRVSTYSPALKGLTTLIFVLLGMFLTVNLLGFNIAVLTSFGVVAAIVTYLSRNLIEDMINGALILYTDRYAVGDVIKVGDVAGFVENMNLYVTELRGDEGRLITIPNGSVKTVENLTKDWSRVDFKIEIAYDADVKKALEVIRQVADRMQSEPEWQEKILEPASILGVDQVSHSGILIQVWIKTLPIQQWAVGREFRLRVKQMFDQAGISIGVPQREIWQHPKS